MGLYKSMKKVSSKHNNLLNYFLYDDKYLSPAYVKKCKKFLERIKKNVDQRSREDNSHIK